MSISAFDVDWDSPFEPEIDNIYIWSGGMWNLLGPLTGEDDEWSYTTFNLDGYFTEVTAGLTVMIDIDSTHTFDNWAVTLAKSVLSLDGGELPDPTPVPEPVTLLLFGFGLAGLAGFKKRFK